MPTRQEYKMKRPAKDSIGLLILLRINQGENHIQYTINQLFIFKSSRAEVFCKKGVLKNVAKLTGKHLCQSLILIKLQAWGLQFY